MLAIEKIDIFFCLFIFGEVGGETFCTFLLLKFDIFDHPGV